MVSLSINSVNKTANKEGFLSALVPVYLNELLAAFHVIVFGSQV